MNRKMNIYIYVHYEEKKNLETLIYIDQSHMIRKMIMPLNPIYIYIYIDI
jgi:hypothetical protein